MRTEYRERSLLSTCAQTVFTAVGTMVGAGVIGYEMFAACQATIKQANQSETSIFLLTLTPSLVLGSVALAVIPAAVVSDVVARRIFS